jgi:hypothetical protein
VNICAELLEALRLLADHEARLIGMEKILDKLDARITRLEKLGWGIVLAIVTAVVGAVLAQK